MMNGVDVLGVSGFHALLMAGDAMACTSVLRDTFAQCRDFARCKRDLVCMVRASTDVPRCAATLTATLLCVWSDATTPLAYLVLMALSDLTSSGVLPTDWASTVLPPAIRAEVAVVVEAALSTDSGVSPKVVVKTLALFQIDHIGLAVVMVYAKKLVVAGAYVSVLKCVEHFTWMPWPHMDMLEAFVATKSWPMAEQLLKIIQPALDGPTFRHLTMSLVTLSTQQQELKRAHRYVHQYNLQDEFPNIDSVFQREALDKLCGQRKWAIATNFVGNNTVLQVDLYHKMAAAGEYELANDLRDRFDLTDVGPRLDRTVKPRSIYLNLPKSIEIVFCDTDSTVHTMEMYFKEVLSRDVRCWVGVDVEWKAVFDKTEMAMASILQIAVGSKVFIVDVIALEASTMCFECLHRLFTNPSYVKIGFGFATDLKVLHQSFPDKLPCFQAVHGHVEVDTVLRHVAPTYSGKSLADATRFLLGKPLDKRHQLSKWELRPLHPLQLQCDRMYAALDAYCLVQMAQLLVNMESSFMHRLTSLSLDVIDDKDAIQYARQYRQLRLQRVMNSHLSDEDHVNPVVAFLQAHPNAVDVQVVSSADDVDNAAAATESELQVVGNSLCLMVNSAPHVAVLHRGHRLDLACVAKAAGVSRRKVRFATPQECVQVFGYAPGTVPPIAHKAPDTCIWVDSYGL
ncbi:hypothetical protein AaE_008495 [Aphanomyces astaci]|uniref:3'-5' exonuclease domain-containing protein n=1 Tax=Aphanomyces astaci TaxID=112090 RepID=A0A6A5A7A1_APHAT|nr:hypothetical protein AaE_008495 [Aphanomyces astaci]